jgi:hypothetical protein
MVVVAAAFGGWGCSSSSDAGQLSGGGGGGASVKDSGASSGHDAASTSSDAGGGTIGDQDSSVETDLDAGNNEATDANVSADTNVASTGFDHHTWTTMNLVAGSEGVEGDLIDGVGSAAQFEMNHSVPYGAGLTYIGNTLYVADDGAGHFRAIDRTTNRVITVGTMGSSMAGRVGLPMQVDTDGKDLYFVAGGNGHWNEYAVVKISLSGGDEADAGYLLTTLAGSTSNTAGTADGTGTSAGFGTLWGIVYDQGILYVSDTNNIRKVTVPGGVVTTIPTKINSPGPLATDHKGHLYFAADSAGTIGGDGTDANRTTINELDLATGTVTVLAGQAGQLGAKDGTGSAARFSGPTGVAVDDQGNVYVADQTNGAIRKVAINGTSSVVTTVVGELGNSSDNGSNLNVVKTGSLSSARLNRPSGILLLPDTGNMIITDRVDEVVLQVQ